MRLDGAKRAEQPVISAQCAASFLCPCSSTRRYASGLPASRQIVSSSVEKVLLRVRALDRTLLTM